MRLRIPSIATVLALASHIAVATAQTSSAPVPSKAKAVAAATKLDRLRTAGICFLAPNQPHMYSGENGLAPKAAAQDYLWRFEHRGVPEDTPAKITLLETAKHGVLREVTEADRGVLFYEGSGPVDPSDPGYAYLPEPGYLGKDKAVFLVQIAGVKVKVIYFLRGVDGNPGEQSMAIYCKRGYIWKISTSTGASSYYA